MRDWVGNVPIIFQISNGFFNIYLPSVPGTWWCRSSILLPSFEHSQQLLSTKSNSKYFQARKLSASNTKGKFQKLINIFFRVKKIIRVFLFVTFCNTVSEEFPTSPTPLFLPFRNFSLDYELTFSSKRNKGPFKCKGPNVNYKTNWSHAYSKISFFCDEKSIFLFCQVIKPN